MALSTPVTATLVTSGILAFIILALSIAYLQGMLDPVIEQVGFWFFKAKAKAEEKKLQAEGMKEGEDFVSGELKGNKQAEDVLEGVGGIGGLKKFAQ